MVPLSSTFHRLTKSVSSRRKPRKVETTPADDRLSGPLGLNLLHNPEEPLVDLIFVHGLGGNSVKTWTKGGSIDNFWPQKWLPEDSAFEHVRIHSFGYNASFKKAKADIWNVHHFGKALLAEMLIAPHLKGRDTPIVLVAHSMGGLVMKKAYILARENALFEAFGKRVRSMVFLATPHKGSGSAKLLNGILHATASARKYVGDLDPGSKSIQTISDAFRGYATDLKLWSLYETKGLNLGMLSKTIVNPNSAVLGCAGEISVPMNADHRSICKYGSRTDPNYVLVRNVLATAMTETMKDEAQRKARRSEEDLATIAQFLKVEDSPSDDLAEIQGSRLSNSCDWFSEKQSFKSWSAPDQDAAPILWLKGNPTMGKSVLAGYVVDQLHRKAISCSYFFFAHGSKTRSQFGDCMKALMYQMACVDASVRRRLSTLHDEITIPEQAAQMDSNLQMWMCEVLKSLSLPHYWVIDGLEQCENTKLFFNSTFTQLNRTASLRAFVTSRETPDLMNLFLDLDDDIYGLETMSTEDTIVDIRHLALEKSMAILAFDEDSRQDLIDKIVNKSCGSFLWVNCILEELATVHGEKEALQVIEEIPEGMEVYYRSSLEAMSSTIPDPTLVKRILTWVIGTIRPLTVQELADTFDVGVGETFPSIRGTITSQCGHFIIVDAKDKVQLVHESARKFLLREDLSSEFAVDEIQAHTDIVRCCLTYLNGPDFKPHLGGRRPSLPQKKNLADYAARAIFMHLSKSNVKEDDVFLLLCTFLECNILSWIEHLTMAKDLSPLYRASGHLKAYLDSLTAEGHGSLSKVELLQGWVTDLVHMPARFSSELVT